jgi:hypothetical protein
MRLITNAGFISSKVLTPRAAPRKAIATMISSKRQWCSPQDFVHWQQIRDRPAAPRLRITPWQQARATKAVYQRPSGTPQTAGALMIQLAMRIHVASELRLRFAAPLRAPHQ